MFEKYGFSNFMMEVGMVEEKVEHYVELAYARVSTEKQKIERQEHAILEAVPEIKAKYFYKDKWTGKEFNREHYEELKAKIVELKEANPDTRIRLTVHELDRIGRDYKEIQQEVYWFRSQRVVLNFLDIPIRQFSEMGITGDLLIDLVIALKAYWAEQELHVKEKRTKEGIERAKANGVKFGRKVIEVDKKQFCREADRAIARNITHKEAMNNLRLKPYVYWKWIKQFYPNYQPNKQKVRVN